MTGLNKNYHLYKKFKMNKKFGWIILYVIIVVVSILIVYRRYIMLGEPEGDSTMNYIIFIFFIVFTYLNLRRLIKLMRDYRK